MQSPHEIGRAIYRFEQRRHFRGHDIDGISDTADDAGGDADEKKATSAREQTVQALKRESKTLGAWLAARGPHERPSEASMSRPNLSEMSSTRFGCLSFQSPSALPFETPSSSSRPSSCP